MEVLSKELQYSDTGYGTLYCIKDGESFVFTLSNYSWSLGVDDKNQIDDAMQWESSFQSAKDKLIGEMEDMIKHFEGWQ